MTIYLDGAVPLPLPNKSISVSQFQAHTITEALRVARVGIHGGPQWRQQQTRSLPPPGMNSRSHQPGYAARASTHRARQRIITEEQAYRPSLRPPFPQTQNSGDFPAGSAFRGHVARPAHLPDEQTGSSFNKDLPKGFFSHRALSALPLCPA